RDVAADRRLARAGVDDVGVRLRDGDRADGGGAEVAVRDAAPGRAAVGGLPDAARTGAVVEGHRIGHVAGHGDDTPAPVGADTAPVERAQQALPQRRRAGPRFARHLRLPQLKWTTDAPVARRMAANLRA